MSETQLANFVDGSWSRSDSAQSLEVTDPATAEVIARVPLSTVDDVDAAVQAAARAFPEWSATPVTARVQHLFRLKRLLEEHLDELARTMTRECGKTLSESAGELRRGIENVEVACGAPSLMQGYNNTDIGGGITEHLFREPLGVVAAITPFNFPGMIPLWFFPYAVATGNCFILKPSEQTPVTGSRLFELIEEAGFPPGVVQLVHGGPETVNALLDHPQIRAISFVGSTPIAKHVYSRAAASGKRVQAQGGAKNPAVILPDADLDAATSAVTESAFGCAGQRCLAISVALTVGEAREPFLERVGEAAERRSVGYGLDDATEMGPVISAASKERIEGLIQRGADEGARVLVDGRGSSISGYERGSFVGPTVLDGVDPRGEIAATEIFGPVLSVMHAGTLEEAIAMVNERPQGNQASLFTSSGGAARRFRQEVRAGNVGINVGVAAPMAFFPFSGFGESFFGDLHAQGRHGVEFYTQTKVVLERWPGE
jgi:malonate-semialdehyde dehydrogenase (acetylating)/methylmalonate-semialdehyde dehydrogenase